MKQLRALPVAAGISETRAETRIEPDGRFLSTEEKGGWIRLTWERRSGEWESRIIQVSRERARQAMDALAAEAQTA